MKGIILSVLFVQLAVTLEAARAKSPAGSGERSWQWNRNSNTHNLSNNRRSATPNIAHRSQNQQVSRPKYVWKPAPSPQSSWQRRGQPQANAKSSWQTNQQNSWQNNQPAQVWQQNPSPSPVVPNPAPSWNSWNPSPSPSSWNGATPSPPQNSWNPAPTPSPWNIWTPAPTPSPAPNGWNVWTPAPNGWNPWTPVPTPAPWNPWTPAPTPAPDTTTPATTVATTTIGPIAADADNSGGCPNPFIRFENFHGFGGAMQPNARSLAECQNLCLTQTSPALCRAFDYDHRTNSCFTYTIDSQSRILPQNGVYHYQRTMCSGNGGGVDGNYTSCSPGLHILGGTLQAGVSTIEACLLACAGSETCQAADFNMNTNMCFFHTSATSCGTLSTLGSATHCKRITCTTNLPPQPPSGYNRESVGFHVLGGTLVDAGISLSACITQCDANTTACFGVDYNKDLGTCFLHSTSTCNGTLVRRDFITNFRKDTCP